VKIIDNCFEIWQELLSKVVTCSGSECVYFAGVSADIRWGGSASTQHCRAFTNHRTLTHHHA